MALRPYQLNAVKAVHKEWDSGNKNTLVVMPTGTGKTIVFSQIVKDQVAKGEKVLILAHREELLKQAADKLKASSGMESALEKAANTSIGSGLDVVVGSVQTLRQKSRLEKFSKDYFGTIIIDEAHHSAADSYKNILEYFNQAKVLGVTATPDRADMKSLSDVFDSLAFEYKLPEAINDGYLCKIRTKTIPLKVDISKVHTLAGDFNPNELGQALDLYLEAIADSIVKECKGRKTVIFTPLVRISQRLNGLLKNRGIDTIEVNGSSKDREKILKDFENGKYDAMTNAMLLTEGWDCPSVDCIICLRPTKSRSLYAQIVGRGTRLCKGKDNLLILDYLWLSGKHSLCHPSDIFCEDAEIAARTTKKLADYAATGCSGPDGTDLIQAIQEAQKEMENEKRQMMRRIEEQEEAVRKRLAEQRQKRKGLVDPFQYMFSIESTAIRDYKPTFGWETKAPSQKAKDAIEGYGVDANSIESAGLANLILKELMKRWDSGMATPKQIRFLENKDFRHVGRWTKTYASGVIGTISDHDWSLPNDFVASKWDHEEKTIENFKELYQPKATNASVQQEQNTINDNQSTACYYAVRGTGITSSRGVCRDGVYTDEVQAKIGMLGFSNAEMKAFNNKADAERWINSCNTRKKAVYICGFLSKDKSIARLEHFSTEDKLMRFYNTVSKIGFAKVFFDINEANTWLESAKSVKTT